MPITKSQFLNQFSKLALDDRISLFLGAGGSRDAGYPNWADLFLPFAKDLKITIDESTDYYLLGQYYSNTFGQPELRKRINEQINRNNYKSRLLDELINVGFTNIWTTNFDNSLEYNFQQRDVLINKVFRDTDYSNIDISKRINIFKMNGDVANLDGIVATQSDFERYADTHRIMMMFFKRELIASTFLFVGYSFTDHLVLEAMSEITRYLGGTTNVHYTIMKRKTDSAFSHFIDDLEKRYQLRVLLVDDYSEIPIVISELNRLIRSKKVFVSGSFSTYGKEIEEYSHLLTRKMSEGLLDNKYRIVNGIGRRFGTHLIGYANEYLARQGVKEIERHLIVRPFVGNEKNASNKKYLLREKVLSTCGAAIFVFGENDRTARAGSSGVMEEFLIARKQHKVIIPINYHGMVSEKIWEEVKSNLTEYPYLEGCIDNLTATYPVDDLIRLIIHILDSTREVI